MSKKEMGDLLKMNLIFLAIGLVLSGISKFYQFKLKDWRIGNILVVPAAVFLCLALLFSIKRFTSLYDDPVTRVQGIIMAVTACGTVVSFQGLTMLVIGQRSMAGLLFLLPLCVCLLVFLKLWFQ
ncbi:MAG: hypothetical protein N2484_07455 [Clostridia bacterium]|nr:hypothetical protein [Clostridia bacterium]